MRRLLGMLSLWIALAAAVAGAQAAFRVYEPRSRTAEELAGLVAPLLGPEGAAIPDPHGGKLILQGDPAAIAAALEALRELDAPLRQYRVESQVTTRAALEGVGFSARGWVDAGGMRLARLAAGAGAARRERRFGAELVVLEGGSAEVWTGESRAVATALGPALVPARSGFRVRPHGLGSGEIELEIEPVVSELRGSNAIRETGGSTRVRVRPGETLAIAAIDDAGAGARAALDGAGAHSESSDSILLVRVTLAGDAAASPEPER